MPFNAETYDEIVLKNLESKIDFEFIKSKKGISKECQLISYGFNQEDVGQKS